VSKIVGGHPDEVELTAQEKAAIGALKALARKWPKSLWLFSGSGSLCVMRAGEDGSPVHTGTGASGGLDPDYVVETIGDRIPNDGGDW
jgi:hypothetical protein